MTGCLVRLVTDRGIVFPMSALALERKLRLFYCGCCRLHWDQLPVAAQELVDVIEQYAVGRSKSPQVRCACRIAEAAVRARWPLRIGLYSPAEQEIHHLVRLAIAATTVRRQILLGAVSISSTINVADQVHLLHELFENPFRPVAIASRWFTPTVIAIAQVIRAERALNLMPVLGDALQDAGCDSAKILEHCYRPDGHIVGGWLVDRLAEAEVG